MPTYDYLCESCGHEFEQFQAMTAKPSRICPKCGKRELRRLIGCGSGVIFKGAGFYQTDYRSESYKKAAESEKGTSGTDTTEKKTAAKPETKDSTPDRKAKLDTKDKKKSA